LLNDAYAGQEAKVVGVLSPKKSRQAVSPHCRGTECVRDKVEKVSAVSNPNGRRTTTTIHAGASSNEAGLPIPW